MQATAEMASIMLVITDTAQGSELSISPHFFGDSILRKTPVAEAPGEQSTVDAGSSQGLVVSGAKYFNSDFVCAHCDVYCLASKT